jgi:hypothetical protein
LARFYYYISQYQNLNIMKRIVSVIAIAATMAMSCNSAAEKEQQAAQERELDSIKTEMARRQVIDSMNEVARLEAETNAKTSKSTTTHTIVYNTKGEPIQQSVNESQTISTGTQTTTKKKGWSAKATGAVIGAGAGAITGAAVSKEKKGQGAVIGGVIGAGTGLGVGAIIDKKNGR